MLEVGTKAPEFTLPDQNGKEHSLSDYKGQKVILYFYPKDQTGGCIKEACSFRDRYPQITEKGAVILGVSKDSVKSHKNFEEKQSLPFTLLSDEDHKVIEMYDVWKEKKMAGRTYMVSATAGTGGFSTGNCLLPAKSAVITISATASAAVRNIGQIG